MTEQPSTQNAERVQTWLRDAALPLWASEGFDSEHGGFFDLLDFDGEPVRDVRKRMRVQARQLYSYSHAALLGWNGGADEPARHGFDFIVDHYWHADGGFIFSANEDGSPLDTSRESYEQAFALLGFAWYYRAFGDDRVLPWVDKTLAFIDSLADPVHGGFQESIPAKLPRRQNPHMHLLEAMLALYEAFKDERYLQRATGIVELAADRFMYGDPLALGEYFTADWSAAEGSEGTMFEPGHHFEWTWLLNQYATSAGRTDAQPLAQQLFLTAESQGVEPATGLAYDECCRDNGVIRASKRLWLQTEALKAHVAIHNIDPTAVVPGRADQLVDAMFEYYLHENGGWQDQLDGDNVGTGTTAPASTLYHLFVAFDQYLRHTIGDYRLG